MCYLEDCDRLVVGSWRWLLVLGFGWRSQEMEEEGRRSQASDGDSRYEPKAWYFRRSLKGNYRKA